MTIRLAVDGRVLDDRYDGIGRITEALLLELSSKSNYAITVFLRKDQQSERFDIPRLLLADRVSTAPFNLALTSPLQWAKWPLALERQHIDVALFPYHLGAAVWSRARRFSIVHDCIIEGNARYSPNRRTRALYRLITTAVVRRNHILVPSRATADEVDRVYSTTTQDWQIVPWGVDNAFAARPEPIRPTLGVVPPKYYLHIGARRPHKNVKVLVAALALSPPDHHLVLVGSVDQRFADPVPRLAADLGVSQRIIELSRVSDAELISLYANATAFLFPSYIEGFGLPLLEAMAAGVPVVAADIPVLREIGASAALFVDADDPMAWANAMAKLEDPALKSSLVEAGTLRAHKSTWGRSAAALMSALSRT